MKKILFVDFNGVLSYVPFWYSLKDPNHKLNKHFNDIENFLFKENVDLIKNWMLGKYSSEEINKIIADKLGISYVLLFKAFKEDCEDMKVSDKILDKLASLKKEYYLILVTGNMDSFDRFTLPKEKKFLEVFDEIHNSYTFGKVKDSEYFKKVIIEKGISFDNCYLIDDHQKTCNLFKELGCTAFCTKTEEEVLNIKL